MQIGDWMFFWRGVTGTIVGVFVISSFCMGMIPAVWGDDHPKKLVRKNKLKRHSLKCLTHKGRTLHRLPHKVVHQIPDRPQEKQESASQFGFSKIPTLAKPALPKEHLRQPTVTVIAQSEEGSPSFTFDWGEHQPAIAVVKEHEGWWIVFDQTGKAILPDISQGLTTVPAEDGIVMHFTAPEHLMPLVTMKGNKWHVLFTLQPLKSQEVAIKFPETEKEGLVIGLEDSGEKVHFKDPHTGFQYIVIPSYKVGVALAQEQIFPEFHLLPTAQGLGFQILQDDIAVDTAWMRVTVTHPKGLAITLPEQRNCERNRAIPIGFFLEAQDLDWTDRRQRISNELLDSPHDLHSAGELELAWLLLSHGKAAEALGYLTHLAQMRPSIVDQPVFQTLQGVSHLLLNKLEEAEAYFRQVREEPEVKVWLTLIKAAQPNDHLSSNASTFHRLRSEKPLLETYPKPLRTQIYRIIMMAGLMKDDLETVAYFFNKESRPQNIAQGEVFDLAMTKLLMKQKKPEAALQLLGKLMENASDPQVKALAHFDYVVHRLNTRMMSPEDAISHLERLHISYRQGDLLGYRLACYLAGLFMNKKRYAKAMALYQAAFKKFPERSRKDGIPRKMSDGFLSYFNQNGSSMPLETLSFFQDYQNTVREEIQNSPEWHRIVRHVVKTLVSADLLNPAGEILSEYLEKRGSNELSEAEKAKIQHQIAALYLMTRQTESALKLIHQMSIPPALREAHVLLQAEGLVQQNKTDEALRVLKDIKTAAPLRAEMCFKARRWSEAASAFKSMIGLERDPEKKAASILNCVISMALAHDSQGLAQMHQSYGDWMKNTPHQAAFEFITDDKIPISGETHLIDLAKIDKTPSFLKALFED
jgi:tetratricopeptide (TPR) repeat protein